MVCASHRFRGQAVNSESVSKLPPSDACSSRRVQRSLRDAFAIPSSPQTHKLPSLSAAIAPPTTSFAIARTKYDGLLTMYPHRPARSLHQSSPAPTSTQSLSGLWNTQATWLNWPRGSSSEESSLLHSERIRTRLLKYCSSVVLPAALGIRSSDWSKQMCDLAATQHRVNMMSCTHKSLPGTQHGTQCM